MEITERATDILLLAPQTVTNGATVTANMDTADGGALGNAKALSAEVEVAFAAQVNTNAVSPTVQVLESDDTVVTNFATIVANQNPVLTAAGVIRYMIDMRPRKRFLRLSVGIPTATNDNQIVHAVGRIRWNKEPSTNADYIGVKTGGGNDTNSTAVLVV